MSIKTKIAALAVAALVVTGGVAASTQTAFAGGGGGGGGNPGLGLGVGLATGLFVGSAIAASQPSYLGYPVRRCWWQPQYNVFHQYMGSARVCNF